MTKVHQSDSIPPHSKSISLCNRNLHLTKKWVESIFLLNVINGKVVELLKTNNFYLDLESRRATGASLSSVFVRPLVKITENRPLAETVSVLPKGKRTNQQTVIVFKDHYKGKNLWVPLSISFCSYWRERKVVPQVAQLAIEIE